MDDRARETLAKLTTAEKASLTSGADFWTTTAIAHAGIPSVMLTDGPHGLRKQTGSADHLGLGSSVPATCFPPAVALACAFDPELAERVGIALGVESAIENVAVILGPGVNIKRSPLCGRNFEYLSEDPLVSGVLGAGLVRGIQSRGVGASLKHFAANNQETDRMRVSADIDERPLHEIYLRAFQRVVTDAQPWTVMCSYSRINGVYASEDHRLLTKLLRDDWGFNGLVVSDWGAVDDRVAALTAGLDLEMPGGSGHSAERIVAAVADGRLPESVLDSAAARVIALARKAEARIHPSHKLDVDAHHALAREAAARSIVLLKNDGGLLPLDPGRRIAVIGEFARTPRFQGGGSSHINPTRVDSALDALAAVAGDHLRFAPGFGFAAADDAASLRDEAVALAAASDVAAVFLGLTEAEESEGFDRTHINLPAAQLELLDAVLVANPNVVVVLSNGSVVALPFADRVPAIVEAWLLGQAGGSATADVLLGEANPSGKLAETIPVRLEDTPAFGNFPGSFGHVRYGEGVFVGYRWYDLRETAVAFPFGHGLSYAVFDYGVAQVHLADDGDLLVTVPVTNTSDRPGREVVQVYLGLDDSAVERPPRELKGFRSVEIPAGETVEVTVTVRSADLAYWDTRVGRFVVEPGTYRVDVGASSRDIRSTSVVDIAGDDVRVALTEHSSLAEAAAHPVVGPAVRASLPKGIFGASDGGASDGEGFADDMVLQMIGSIPLGRLPGFPSAGVTADDIRKLIAAANSAEPPD